MRIVGWAIAVMVALASPSLALAAGKDNPAITKEARAKGMADAPALLQAAGSDCQIGDARFIGEAADAKTKSKIDLYEVACTGSEGFLVEKTSTQPAPELFTCMEAKSAAEAGNKTANQCILPGNADPTAGLVPFIQKAGVTCTPDKVRAIGHSSTTVYFEIACHEGAPGYILEISTPASLSKPVQADPCIGFDPNTNPHCELTDRTTQMSIVDRLTKGSGKPCDVKDRGYIGVGSTGATYYEVACQDGKGFVLQSDAKGAFIKAIPCIEAEGIAGGCKLTDTRQAKTEQNGLYSELAKKAGFDCTVSGYGPFDVAEQGKEVVELVCSNRPDGAVAVFPASGAGGVVYDCAHSELMGYRCTLNKPAASYGKLTDDLKALGKNTCQVSETRVVGVAADQTGYIEVGCSDGLPGYMVSYTMNPIKPKSPLVCAEAKGIGGGCTLPHNATKS